MTKRCRRQQVELDLLHSHINLPAWKSLPESCRDEVVALIVELLRQHAKPRAGAPKPGGRDE
jgi:hypothetical protein